MKIKIQVIGIIKKEDKILMRKKPDGSPPYKETWYLFGGELIHEKSPEQAIKDVVKNQTGINIKMIKSLGWDTEIKKDTDGETKFFIYLDSICKYINGKIKPSEEIEKLELIPVQKLKEHDLVPPSRKLFKKLGYIT